MNPALARIAVGFYGSDALPQLLHALHPAAQAGSLKHADLDLRHIEPTGVFGRLVKLQAAQHPAGFLGREGVV